MYAILVKNMLVTCADHPVSSDILNEVKEKYDEEEICLYEFPNMTMEDELNKLIRPIIFIQDIIEQRQDKELSSFNEENLFRFKEICNIIAIYEYRVLHEYLFNTELPSQLQEYPEWVKIQSFPEWVSNSKLVLTMLDNDTIEESLKDIKQGLLGWLSVITVLDKIITELNKETLTEENVESFDSSVDLDDSKISDNLDNVVDLEDYKNKPIFTD